MTIWTAERPDFMGRPHISERPMLLESVARDAPKLTEGRGLARFIPEAIRKRVVEAMGGGTLLGQWAGGSDPDFAGYRPLSMQIDHITRDLDATTYDKQVRMALYLYATNPLATWLVDTLVHLCVGQTLGFSVTVKPVEPEKGLKAKKVTEAFPAGNEPDDDEADEEDEDAPAKKPAVAEETPEQQKAAALEKEITDHLKRFWEHPAHSLATRADEYAQTFLTTGALLLPVVVNPADGVPMLDLVDAQQISKVASADKSAIVPGTVFYRPSDSAGDPKPLRVIRQEAGQTDLVGQHAAGDGMAFYFPLRKLLNQLMGTSYLLNVIDWLDRHDQFLFAALDRAKLANVFAWCLKMQGLTPEQCKAKADELTRSGAFGNPGSVVVTNDQGELTAVSADLGAGEVETTARTYRLHILGSKGYPEAWYANGGETNRATAGNQTSVALKIMEGWQTKFRGMFEFMLAYAYDQGRAHGRSNWPERSTGMVDLKVNMPPLREEDFGAVGAALSQLETALEAAVEGEMLSRETAREVFLTVASTLGADIDVSEERARIDGEAKDREARAQEKFNAAARAFAGGKLAGDQDEGEETE